MATPTLVSTAGGNNSNSYCSLAEANTYFDARLHQGDWIDAENDTKTVALIHATRVLDRDVFWTEGAMTSSGQALQWPRKKVYDLRGVQVSSSSVPQFIKDATSELALHLVSSDREGPVDTEGLSGINLGPVRLAFREGSKEPHIIPKSVMAIIEPWAKLRLGSTRRLRRV
jgi:hypothetical protein